MWKICSFSFIILHLSHHECHTVPVVVIIVLWTCDNLSTLGLWKWFDVYVPYVFLFWLQNTIQLLQVQHDPAYHRVVIWERRDTCQNAMTLPFAVHAIFAACMHTVWLTEYKYVVILVFLRRGSGMLMQLIGCWTSKRTPIFFCCRTMTVGKCSHTHTHTDSVQGWWLWEGNHRSGRKQWQPAVGFVINVTCLINWRSATALKSLGTVACTGPCLTASTKQKGCLAGQLGPGLPGSPSSLPSHNTRAVITLILWEISEAVGTPFPNCWGYLLELC